MVMGLAASALVLLALPASPRARAVIVSTLVMLALAVFQTGNGREGFSATFTTLTLLTVAGAALLLPRRHRLITAFLPLLAYLAIGYVFLWPSNPGITGNTLNLAVAVSGWVVGVWLCGALGDTPNGLAILTRILFLIVLFEAVVSLLQLAGIPLFPLTGRTLDLEGGRVNGTYTHPSTSGKVATLLLVLLLPATKVAEASTRRYAYFAIILSAVPVFATLSRANTVALLAMVLVWSLIQPREKYLGARFVLPAVVGIAGLFVLDEILARFAADPEGGARDRFLEAALQQLGQTPVFGVGPGQYIRSVGSFDQLTSEGWPVHNIFVLEAVELGLIGAVLLFAPIVWTVIVALRSSRAIGPGGDQARAVLAYVPALIAIGTTGWGLIDVPMSALLMFTMGFAGTQIVTDRRRLAANSSNLVQADNAPRGAFGPAGRPINRSARLRGLT